MEKHLAEVARKDGYTWETGFNEIRCVKMIQTYYNQCFYY